MADFGTPVAGQATFNPQQGLQTLSALLSLKQQQQQLKSETAAATVAQMDAQQYQAASKVNWQGYVKPDGSFDTQGATSKMLEVAPNHPEWAERMVQTATSGAQARKALFDLSQDYQAPIRAAFGTWAADPKSQPSDLAAQLQAISEDAPKSEQGNLDKIIKNTFGVMNGPDVFTGQPKSLQQQKAAALAYSRAGLSPSETSGPGGVASATPATVNTGGAIVPGSVAPPASGTPGAFTPQGPKIPTTLPPGAQIVHDAYGRTFVFNPQTNSIAPIGAGAAPGAQPPASGGAPGASPGFQQPVAAQQQVLHDLENTRAIADIGPTNRNINQHLLELSEETSTGPYHQTLQKIAAAVGLPSGAGYQEIGAYLDRQAAMQARAMGVPNTNAGLAAAQTASGTTEYTPAALQEKIRFADALNSGAMAYRQGLDKLVGTGATPNLGQYQAFRSAWARNFDPDVYRAEDAIRTGDKPELEALKKRLGPQGMRQLATKSANLRLLENGEIPNG